MLETSYNGEIQVVCLQNDSLIAVERHKRYSLLCFVTITKTVVNFVYNFSIIISRLLSPWDQ